MLTKTFGSSVYGINAMTVTIEVSVTTGANFYIVGMPDSAIKESQYRIELAMKYLGYKFPRQKVVVNMAPADIRKEGSSYDLAIALGMLSASGQIFAQDTIGEYMILGELALDGDLRSVKGVLPIAIEARKQGFKGLILPEENSSEASIVNNLDVIGVKNMIFWKKNYIFPQKKAEQERFFRKRLIFMMQILHTYKGKKI
jgi:magnesium chelatase family protein